MDRMKTKFLIAVLVVSGILLVYSIVCYRILNKRIEINTRNSISTYFNTYLSDVSSYEFIKAISNKKDTFQVFVKTKDNYYTLVNIKNDKFKVYFDGRCTHINSSYEMNLNEEDFNYDNIYLKK